MDSSLQIKINIQGRKTIVWSNGKQMEMKTAFLKRFTMNDFIEYTKEKLK